MATTDPQIKVKMWRNSLVVVLLLPVLCIARGPPRVLQKNPYRQLARAGEEFRLTCPVESDPEPMRQWTKDGHQISEAGGWDRYRVLRKGILKITPLTEEDTGIFKCQATNGFGSVQIEYLLYVMPDTNDTAVTPPWENPANTRDFFPGHSKSKMAAPTWYKARKSVSEGVTRPVGSSIRMKCRAKGDPRPDVVWLHNGQPVEDASGLRPRHERHNRWSLRLEGLLKTDSGAYTCKVFNEAGVINYTYHLNVVDKSLSKPMLVPPHPQNVTVAPGGVAVFQCKVISLVQPHIQWLKKIPRPTTKLNATIEVKGVHYLVLKTGKAWSRKDGSYLNKLTLTDVRPRDSGLYICLGTNSVGFTFRSSYLTVLPVRERPADGGFKLFGSDTSLPLLIALPAAAGVILITVIIFLVQRHRRDRGPSKVSRPVKPPVRTAQPTDKPQYDQYSAVNYHNLSAGSRDRSTVKSPYSESSQRSETSGNSPHSNPLLQQQQPHHAHSNGHAPQLVQHMHGNGVGPPLSNGGGPLLAGHLAALRSNGVLAPSNTNTYTSSGSSVAAPPGGIIPQYEPPPHSLHQNTMYSHGSLPRGSSSHRSVPSYQNGYAPQPHLQQPPLHPLHHPLPPPNSTAVNPPAIDFKDYTLPQQQQQQNQFNQRVQHYGGC